MDPDIPTFLIASKMYSECKFEILVMLAGQNGNQASRSAQISSPEPLASVAPFLTLIQSCKIYTNSFSRLLNTADQFLSFEVHFPDPTVSLLRMVWNGWIQVLITCVWDTLSESCHHEIWPSRERILGGMLRPDVLPARQEARLLDVTLRTTEPFDRGFLAKMTICSLISFLWHNSPPMRPEWCYGLPAAMLWGSPAHREEGVTCKFPSWLHPLIFQGTISINCQTREWISLRVVF